MDNNIQTYKKPKRKALKIILLVILCLVLGVGIWLGSTVYNTLKKVTAFSSGSDNSVWSLLNKNKATLKGESDGRTNILLIGHGGGSHPGANLADTIQVLSVNWKTNQIAFISVPRDLWVNIPGYGQAKINESYSNGEQNKKTTGGGGAETSKVVSDILGIPIHYFVSFDFDGFTEMINKIGGIDVNVPVAITDRNYPLYDNGPVTTFQISAGQHHMDGNLALKYARSRESTSDFDRSKRQQLIMIAVKKKALNLDILANPEKITSLLNSIGNHVSTSLSINEIKSLWDEIKLVDTTNIITKVIDNSANGLLMSSTSAGGASIQIPKKGINNYTDLRAMAKNIFSDANAPKIELLNGTGKTAQLAKTETQLEAVGVAITDTKTASKKYTDTIIYNCSGDKFKSTVQKIITTIGGTEKASPTCDSFDIEIILGQSALTN